VTNSKTVPLTLPQALELAVQHHRAGRRAEAKSLYQQILSQHVQQPDALHLLGILCGEERDIPTAERLIRQAIQVRPTATNYYQSLGKLLKESRRPQEALPAYLKAVEFAPNSPEALAGLGGVLFALGRSAEAIGCFEKALTCETKLPAAVVAPWHNELGVALATSDRLDEALAELQAASQLLPNYAEPYANAALVLQRQGRLLEALAACRRAIELQTDHANTYNSMGVVLAKLGRHEESIRATRRAIQLNPTNPGFYSNLVQRLSTHGDVDEALATCRQAIGMAPRAGQLYQALGNVLKDVGSLDESLAAFGCAIELDPRDASAHSGRIFARHFHSGSDQRAQAEDLRLWDKRHGLPLRNPNPHTNDCDPERRLRIGYISPDFTNHVLAFSMLPVFSSHDHSKIETRFYSDVCDPRAVTERFRACADRWTNIVGLSDEQVAQMIRNDQVDILVDLTMHMRNNRLLVFARKPAPVQVTWAAYPGSTGLSAIDYRLTDPYLDPPGMFDEFFSERSIRLPETFWCYDPLSEDPGVGPAPIVENGFITFGCLNNFCKINRGILRLWARVLRAVPNSRLLLLCPKGSHRKWVYETFVAAGVSADRVKLTHGRPRPEYLQLYHAIDISLDPLPYNGHTTSLDSFWMGVPLITMAGETVVGRAGVSQLTNLGLTELIAQNADQYVDLAVRLSTDVPRLIGMRAGMRQRMKQSPLMDGERFARNVETAYRQMWHRWCQEHTTG
jgi:predicted O-linked N-acetylglucosamine transferase (SPINDLY family)